jgi:predicted  nucleic acid-binding Zn-ribbon protein
MIRQFVPAEFFAVSLRSWLTQFKYAMKMIKTHPEIALMYLVDTNYDRWKTICSEIENIDDVFVAIEFLGDSLDMKKGCCSPQHRKIERAIEVAKFAALPMREAESLSYINELEQEIGKLTQTEENMKQDIQELNDEIEPIRKKLRKNARGSEPEEETRVNRMIKRIVNMEQSRRETVEKIRMMTRELNIWKRHMATIRPFAEQNTGL